MSLLDTSKIVKVDKAVAHAALQEYRKHRAAATPEDEAIMRAYKEITRGRVVVQAIASVRAAGWNKDWMPALALTRADVRQCAFQAGHASAVEFYDDINRGYRRRSSIVVRDMPPRPQGAPWRGAAAVPLVPLPLRPKAALDNYHILWEADWSQAPVDPLLLRKLQGDLWLVLAAWELTAVERAVLEQRVNS